MQTSKAGTTAAKGIHGWMTALFNPLGFINHPRILEFDGDKPSGTLSFSVYVELWKKSAATIVEMAMGTPKSPKALRT